MKHQSIEQIEAFAHHYLLALGVLSRMRANRQYHSYIPAFQKALLEANILLYPEEEITWKRVLRFLWVDLPAQLWENRYYYLASTLICGACTLIGFITVLQNFEMAPVFIPSGLRSSHELEAYLFSNHAQADMLTAGREGGLGEKAFFATALMINNIKVAIMCFTAGILFGIPTVLILVQTGLMLGALPALFYHGDLVGLGAWLLPHGVPEIGAILLAGGAGLKLGLSLLQPSSEKMSIRFRKVLTSVSGTIVLCVILLIQAGLVESFVRQSDLSNDARYLIAAVSVIPFILIFIRAYMAHREITQTQIGMLPE